MDKFKIKYKDIVLGASGISKGKLVRLTVICNGYNKSAKNYDYWIVVKYDNHLQLESESETGYYKAEKLFKKFCCKYNLTFDTYWGKKFIGTLEQAEEEEREANRKSREKRKRIKEKELALKEDIRKGCFLVMW